MSFVVRAEQTILTFLRRFAVTCVSAKSTIQTSWRPPRYWPHTFRARTVFPLPSGPRIRHFPSSSSLDFAKLTLASSTKTRLPLLLISSKEGQLSSASRSPNWIIRSSTAITFPTNARRQGQGQNTICREPPTAGQKESAVAHCAPHILIGVSHHSPVQPILAGPSPWRNLPKKNQLTRAPEVVQASSRLHGSPAALQSIREQKSQGCQQGRLAPQKGRKTRWSSQEGPHQPSHTRTTLRSLVLQIIYDADRKRRTWTLGALRT